MKTEAARYNVLECGRRFGKTVLGQNLVSETAIQGHPSAWLAPTYKYLAEAWRAIVGALAPATKRLDHQEHRIELISGGVIDFWSMDTPDPGRGRKYKRVVFDEAGIVRDLEAVWQQAIRPTLVDLKGDAWFLGTPKGRGYFHQLYGLGQGGDKDWKSWRFGTIANPIIDEKEIEAARRGMPDAVYRQEFLGEPAEDSGNPFGMKAIAACIAPLSDGPVAVYGIDLAKSQDWTVVCGLTEEGACCCLERWQSDWGQTRRRILDIIGETPTLVDSTGVGDPIVEDLIRERPCVEGFKFTHKSKQQLMEGLAASVQRAEIRFPDGWLQAEMESFGYEYRAGGVFYSAPEGMHDDGVMALALAEMKRRQFGRGIEVRFLERAGVAPDDAERGWVDYHYEH